MMNIKIVKQDNNNYQQIFSVFNEENWQLNSDKFPKETSTFFSGKKNEVFTIVEDQSVTYLIGIGNEKTPLFEIQDIANKFSQKYKKNLKSVVTKIHSESLSEESFHEFIKGLFLGTYNYNSYLSHPFWHQDFQVHFPLFSQEILDEVARQTLAICQGQFACMEWLNKPANHKTTNHISDYLQKLATEKNLKYTIYNKQECETIGLGAFLSVNQGSANEAAFTILEYTSETENAPTIGLVGKCVLFDTGGISIKPSDNMHYMKSDMGGATAVIGTLITAAELHLPINIVAILPITDNAVSNTAYLPSDVVKAYNGKTIEVLNTDAEGRMTLADGLSYLAKNYKTTTLIDLATLTGSAVRMFGNTCGAMFSNNEELKQQLLNAGEQTNQKLWNLPLWDIWLEDIQSDVADFKNISMKPIGDCIVAAKFLEQFIEEHPRWAHLDIAGMAFGNVNYAKEKAATGYGVQLLINLMKNLH
ncbi:MAG: leucyl aminopeptidase family protein [Cruoricaptor ignavus]|nr:leucyl aminopeptidase family protein [Cruoricaptor ignavus]